MSRNIKCLEVQRIERDDDEDMDTSTSCEDTVEMDYEELKSIIKGKY